MRIAALLSVLRQERPAPPLLAMALVEALAAVTSAPAVKTTEGMLLRDLLQEAAALGRPLFALFNHPARACLTWAGPFLVQPLLTPDSGGFQGCMQAVHVSNSSMSSLDSIIPVGDRTGSRRSSADHAGGGRGWCHLRRSHA